MRRRHSYARSSSVFIGLRFTRWRTLLDSLDPHERRRTRYFATLAGSCAPTLIELSDGNVVALWASVNGRLSAQSIDARDGALLGPVVDLGYMATAGGAFAPQPFAVLMPDGDLALVGLLRDGRVTFARGSEDTVRRVGPKLIVRATSSDVLGIAAAPHGTGVTVLLLRAPDGYDPKTLRSPAETQVELYELGPTGDRLHHVRVQVEQTLNGSHVRLPIADAACALSNTC